MTARTRQRLSLLGFGVLPVVVGACNLIAGLDKFSEGRGGGGPGGAGGSSSSSSAAQCTPNATASCYDGDPATVDAGICKAGTKKCDSRGQSWGPCLGQVTPAAKDDCSTQLDENCDGVVNDNCPCTPNEPAACFSGNATARKTGQCKDGSHTCNASGTGYVESGCPGEVLPAATDDCSNTIDEDCSGSYCSQTLWAKNYNAWGGYQSNPILAVDSANNILLAGIGQLDGTVLDQNSGYLTKLDPNGAYLWKHRYGGLTITNIVTDTLGNAYVSGYLWGFVDLSPCAGMSPCSLSDTMGNLFVAKLDSDGNVKWATNFSPASCGGGGGYISYGSALIAVSENNVFVAGQECGGMAWGTDKLPATSTNYVGKLDIQTGVAQWVRQQNTGPAIAADAASHLFSTYTDYSVTPSRTSFQVTDKNGYTLTGASVTGFTPSSLAVDQAGTAVYGVGTYVPPLTIGGTTLPSGDANARGMVVTKLDLTTSAVSVVTAVMGTGVGFGNVVMAVTPDSGFALVGTVTGKPNFGGGAVGTVSASNYQVFVAKLDKTGKHLWSRGFGDQSLFARTSSVAVDSVGSILVPVVNAGTADFGPAQTGTAHFVYDSTVDYYGQTLIAKFAGQ